MEIKRTSGKANYIGLMGWVWPAKYKFERHLYTLHRVTGILLLLFVLIHLISVAIFQIQGQNAFASTIIMFQNSWWRVFALIALTAFGFHALNGIRLVLQQLGFTLGDPKPPIFPYSDALRRNRVATFIIVAVAILFILALLLDLVAGGW